jgi:hypothetical protein
MLAIGKRWFRPSKYASNSADRQANINGEIKMITVQKSANIGNTFIGLVCTAFNLKDARQVSMPYDMQHGGMGTVIVKDTAYDYRDRGDSVSFFKAE